jgi:subtilisin family serine protease
MAKGLNEAWKRRVHPRLRVMLNSSPTVNAQRAVATGCLVVGGPAAKKAKPLEIVPASEVKPQTARIKDLDPKDKQRNDVLVSVFVRKRSKIDIPGERAKLDNEFAMARIPLDELKEWAKRPEIGFFEQAENLKQPGAMRLATGRDPPQRKESITKGVKLHRDGKGVLIGVVDVEGFDWLHPDFTDQNDPNKKSRFIRIWDQGRSNGKCPRDRYADRHPDRDARNGPWAQFDYGVEITSEDMEKARKEAGEVHVSPHDLEPQSQMIPGSHGIHVASIAAGNSGVASKAEIAAVLVSIPSEDTERRKSFYDSTRLLDAVNYLLAVAEELDNRQISINVSLGTNGHAHDGSSTLDRWIEALLAKPGRSLCVAAGNAGQEREEHPGDFGYMLGRIHTSGQIHAKGLKHDIEWIVQGNGVTDVSENELEFWYESQDRIDVSIKSPGGEWIGPISPGEYIENMQLGAADMLLSIYNELYNPTNGNNYISIYLSPYLDEEKIIGVRPGTWLVRLEGREIRDGRFHGWIERDDPLAQGDGQYFWPSYFSERSNVDSNSVSSLACGWRVVSVANLDEMGQRINVSSSQGPTRDGRFKPDVRPVERR